MSFIFLLGILACCIAGCVTVNRFGFALEGARCALDRIFYDSVNGQIKVDEPKWKGFYQLDKLQDELKDYKGNDNIDEKTWERHNDKEVSELRDILTNINNQIKDKPFTNQLKSKFTVEEENFKSLKEKFLKECYNYESILKGCMKILAMIYFCFLLITVTFAAVSLMFYACLKRQGYLITLMHVLWNIIRFFMVSFFIFGTAYGIIDLALTDSIAVIQYLFSKDYLIDQTSVDKRVVPNSDFLQKCLKNDYEYLIDELITDMDSSLKNLNG